MQDRRSKARPPRYCAYAWTERRLGKEDRHSISLATWNRQEFDLDQNHVAIGFSSFGLPGRQRQARECGPLILTVRKPLPQAGHVRRATTLNANLLEFQKPPW